MPSLSSTASYRYGVQAAAAVAYADGDVWACWYGDKPRMSGRVAVVPFFVGPEKTS